MDCAFDRSLHAKFNILIKRSIQLNQGFYFVLLEEEKRTANVCSSSVSYHQQNVWIFIRGATFSLLPNTFGTRIEMLAVSMSRLLYFRRCCIIWNFVLCSCVKLSVFSFLLSDPSLRSVCDFHAIYSRFSRNQLASLPHSARKL